MSYFLLKTLIFLLLCVFPINFKVETMFLFFKGIRI